MTYPPVLVVDDHPVMARALAELVRSLGYEADVVHGGEAALAYVRSRPAALVVLDLQMPGMSGIEVLRTLRGEARSARLPVVVCSALPAEAARDEALRSGAQEYVVKNDAFEELEGALDRHIPSRATGMAGR